MTDVVVGQTLFYAWRYGKGIRPLVVEKVGRKWITFDSGLRAEVGTLRVEEGQGTLWPSRELYEETQKNNAAWKEFQQAIRDRWNRPDWISAEAIAEARKVLGL